MTTGGSVGTSCFPPRSVESLTASLGLQLGASERSLAARPLYSPNGLPLARCDLPTDRCSQTDSSSQPHESLALPAPLLAHHPHPSSPSPSRLPNDSLRVLEPSASNSPSPCTPCPAPLGSPVPQCERRTRPPAPQFRPFRLVC